MREIIFPDNYCIDSFDSIDKLLVADESHASCLCNQRTSWSLELCRLHTSVFFLRIPSNVSVVLCDYHCTHIIVCMLNCVATCMQKWAQLSVASKKMTWFNSIFSSQKYFFFTKYFSLAKLFFRHNIFSPRIYFVKKIFFLGNYFFFAKYFFFVKIFFLRKNMFSSQ